jgi:hypothetical protein
MVVAAGWLKRSSTISPSPTWPAAPWQQLIFWRKSARFKKLTTKAQRPQRKKGDKERTRVLLLIILCVLCVFVVNLFSSSSVVNSYPNPLSVPNQLRKCLHHPPVELHPRPLQYIRPGLLPRPGGAVRAVVSERVPHVDHGKNARGQRDLLALDPLRVAITVPVLVVIFGDRQGCAEIRDGRMVRCRKPLACM